MFDQTTNRRLSVTSSTSGLDDSAAAAAAVSLSPPDAALFAALKRRLKNTTFTGHFDSRGLVQSLAAYRDKIIVDPLREPQFTAQLVYVRDKLLSWLKRDPPIWIGCTFTIDTLPPSWLIWTQLPANTPFGEYRFRVKTLRLRANEVHLAVRIVADDAGPAGQKTAGADDSCVHAASFDADAVAWQIVALVVQLVAAAAEAARGVRQWLVTREMSWTQLVASIRYTASVLAVLLMLAVNLVGWLGAFTLRLMFEARQWAIVLMPLLLRVVDVVNNVLGALFMLLAMIVRDLMNGLFGGRGRGDRMPAAIGYGGGGGGGGRYGQQGGRPRYRQH